MKTSRPKPRTTRTLCAQAREWVKLSLATAAGGVFIWSCVQASIAWEGKILLFSLCLILLGHASPLMLLLDRLPKFSGLSKQPEPQSSSPSQSSH